MTRKNRELFHYFFKVGRFRSRGLTPLGLFLMLCTCTMLSCTAIVIPKFWNQVFLSDKCTKSGAIFLKMKMQCETALLNKTHAVLYCIRNSKILESSFFVGQVDEKRCHFFENENAASDSMGVVLIFLV